MGKVIFSKKILLFLRKTRWLMLLVTLVAMGLTYILHLYLEKRELALYESHLEKILQVRRQYISDFLQKNKEGTSLLSTDKTIMDYVEKAVIFNLDKKNQKTSSYETLYQKMQNTVASFQRQYNFTKVILMSPEGKVLFALNHRGEGQDFLNNGVMHQTVKKSLDRVRATLALDVSEISFNPETGSPILLMSSPMAAGGKIIGIICVVLEHGSLFDKINDFSDLGESGEIILTKLADPGAIIIAPTRKSKHDSFKSYLTLKEKRDVPLIYASRGQRGSSITGDYAGEKAFSSWDFIPQLNMGITGRQSISELDKLTSYGMTLARWFSVAVCFTLLLGTILGFILWAQDDINGQQTWNKKIIKQYLIICILLMACVVSCTILWQEYHQKKLIESAQQSEFHYLQVGREQLERSIKPWENIAHSLGKDLQSGRLKSGEITKRLSQDLDENQNLLGISIAYQPYAYQKNKYLFAPYYYRNQKTIVHHDLGVTFDYAQTAIEFMPWFQETLKKGSHWSKPFKDPITHQHVMTYAVPFYASERENHNEPVGVISLFYPISALRELVNKLDYGRSGYYILTDQKGNFLSYPLEEYVTNQKNIQNLAQEIEVPEFLDLLEMMTRSESGTISYRDPASKDIISIHLEPMTSIKWNLLKVGVEKEILDQPLRDKIIDITIIVEFICLGILLALWVGGAHRLTINNFRLSLHIISLFLLAFNIALWIRVYNSPPQEHNDETIINDQLYLNLFLEDQMKKDNILHQPHLLPFPTGIYLNEIYLKQEMGSFHFNGKIWQQSTPDVSNILFPQALNVDIFATQDTKIGENHFKTWDLEAELLQQFSFQDYPFDQHFVRISLNPFLKDKKVLLIPALGSYRFLAPSLKPGVSPSIAPNGFTLTKSYFSYDKIKTNTDYGLNTISKSQDHYQLNYVLLIKRNIVDAIIVYVLPLSVIIILLFSVITIMHRWVENALGILGALTFALIILHRNLRASFMASQIIYMDYIFISFYFMMLYTIIYAVVLHLKSEFRESKSSVNVIIVSFFWPLTLLLWIWATLYSFYLL